MNNLSTPSSTDITSQIGALELGDYLESCGDDVLEAAVFASNQPNTNPRQYLTCVADGALEAAGASMALGPTLGDFGCGAVPRTNYCVRR
jgi:hypothetical protein